MDSPRRQQSISLCQLHFTTPHPSQVGVPTRLPDALGCCPSTAGGQGATLSTFPWSRSRVNLRVLKPLTRGSQGQPSPQQTPHGCPGFQSIFLTSRGQVPHGWPMVHHSMATGFPIPRGCCLALSVSLPIPCPIPLLPHPGTGPFPASHGLPTPSGGCAAPAPRPSAPRLLVPSSLVYTPPGGQEPFGAGPLDPLPSRDRFVRLARVAPFPHPSLSPVQQPRPNPLGLLSGPIPSLIPCLYPTGPPATL